MSNQPQKNIDFENVTQEERDNWYHEQKVMCIGCSDNNNDRCGWIKKKFKEWKLDGGRVLDLACHDGYVTRRFLDADCHLTGIDISVDAIRVAKEQTKIHYPENKKYEYRASNFLSERSWVDEGWDLIVCFEFIEHIPYDKVGILIGLMNIASDKYVAISTPRESGRYGSSDHNTSHINLYEEGKLYSQIHSMTGKEPVIIQDENFLYAYWWAGRDEEPVYGDN